MGPGINIGFFIRIETLNIDTEVTFRLKIPAVKVAVLWDVTQCVYIHFKGTWCFRFKGKTWGISVSSSNWRKDIRLKRGSTHLHNPKGNTLNSKLCSKHHTLMYILMQWQTLLSLILKSAIYPKILSIDCASFLYDVSGPLVFSLLFSFPFACR